MEKPWIRWAGCWPPAACWTWPSPTRPISSAWSKGFFQGDYDFLNQSQESRLPGFYTHTGDWQRVEEDGQTLLLQDGSHYGSSFSTGLANMMGKMMGRKYLEILDNIGAYFYFPLAIAKESYVTDAALQVRVKPVAGSIDQAGGLAFGIRNVGNYFVFRINALEDNVILFEFVNNKRLTRATVHRKSEGPVVSRSSGDLRQYPERLSG